VAVINATFARRIFGFVSNAIGSYYKRGDGTRVQVVGVVEDGKYGLLTEDQRPANVSPVAAEAYPPDRSGRALRL